MMNPWEMDWSSEKPPWERDWKQPAATPKAPERGFGEQLVRQAGLGARYAIEGANALPAAIANGLGAAYNLTAGQLGAPRAPTDWGGSLSGALDRFLPHPETRNENIAGAVSSAAVPAGLTSKLASMAPQATLAASKALRQIATRPAAEIISGAVGGGAPEAVKQAGGGQMAQLAAGVIAPSAVNAGIGVVGMVGRGARELVRPITAKGQEQVAADVVGRLAQDKQKSLDNLARFAALRDLERQTQTDILGVPGVRPTAAAVAADYGLAGAEQAISRGDAAPSFAKQFAQNNEARLAQLQKLNATDKAIQFYETKRDNITGPLRDAAFSNAKGPVDYTPVAERLGALAATAEGGRAESQRALKWVAGKLGEYADEGRVGPDYAYALYKDIADLVKGKINDDKGAIRLAGGMANELKKVLGQQIELAAPGFKNYLEHYARLSKPIDRLKAITERLGNQTGDLMKVTNAGVASTGDQASHILSQDKLRRAASDLKSEGLTQRQSDLLGGVLGDLNAATFAATGGKMPGSDTYQNMAAANLVSRVLGQGLADTPVVGKAAQKASGLLYKPTGIEQRIQQTIVDAFQDPEKMKRLLEMARTSRQSPTLVGTTPFITGGLLGALSH